MDGSPSQPTFESFLATPATLRAYRRCRARVEAGCVVAGVLLLYGGPGSGKTHLLRATANAARNLMAVWRVEQTSAVDLSARVIKELMQREATDALQVGDEFDMLIVDDLQWLLGKPGSQRYVAMLFRRMAASGASVICASGVAPRRLPELASVLRGESRYESVRIRMPEREVRRVIRHLADTRGVPLSAATVNLLAQRCRGDLGQAAGVVAQFEAAVRWPTSDAAAVAVDRLMRPSV